MTNKFCLSDDHRHLTILTELGLVAREMVLFASYKGARFFIPSYCPNFDGP